MKNKIKNRLSFSLIFFSFFTFSRLLNTMVYINYKLSKTIKEIQNMQTQRHSDYIQYGVNLLRLEGLQ